MIDKVHDLEEFVDKKIDEVTNSYIDCKGNLYDLYEKENLTKLFNELRGYIDDGYVEDSHGVINELEKKLVLKNDETDDIMR